MLLLTVATACDKKLVFAAYQQADARGWEKNDAFDFQTDTLKESATYAMTLGLRVNDKYPFQNLHVVIDQTAMPSRQMVTDTVTCHVADRRGRPLGHGVALYQFDIPVRKRFYLAHSTVRFRVRHNMKREILPGVADIGITLRKE